MKTVDLCGVQVPRLLSSRIMLAPDGCWRWAGVVNESGYGIYNKKRAHRVVYELFKGKIGDGLVLDHLCRNRVCVNPDHLEQVTIGENVRRSPLHGVSGRAKTHCPSGHEYSGENLKRSKDGTRVCVTCRRAKDERRRRALGMKPKPNTSTPEQRAYWRGRYNLNRDEAVKYARLRRLEKKT